MNGWGQTGISTEGENEHMTSGNTKGPHTSRGILLMACVAALGIAFAVAPPRTARAHGRDRRRTATGARGISRSRRGTGLSSWVTLLAHRTTFACLPVPASPGYCSRRRRTCSTVEDDRFRPTTSAPTPPRAAPCAPSGRTPGTRASSGVGQSNPPRTRTSSRRTPFPGYWWKWLTTKRDQRGATS